MASSCFLLQRLRKSFPFALRHLCSQTVTFASPVTSRTTLVSYHKGLYPFYPFQHSTPARSISYESVNLDLSNGKLRFKIDDVEPSKKKKWQTKKRLKLQRKREKKKRKKANKNDPRRIRPKGTKTKHKFPTAEARIKYKIDKAKMKEALLVEKLKKYEVAKVQGPIGKQQDLTGEERFYLKKISQKKSNYVPVGRRGIFGGVILNMHLHWKKHETVKVICKPCKPGQVHEYAREISRLSGGVPIHVIGNDTIVFYRGKNYVQPEVMSPIDTLSKKKALEKSKYEQSLETVRRFIAISEKELELYYRHIALYGDPQSRNADLVYGDGTNTLSMVTDEQACLNGLCASKSNRELVSLASNLTCGDGSDHSDSDYELICSDEKLTDIDCASEVEDVSDSELDAEEKEGASGTDSDSSLPFEYHPDP